MDIIFLDPPFRKNLAFLCLNWIASCEILRPDGFVYLETERNYKLPFPFEQWEQWEILKEKTAGQVCYRLLKPKIYFENSNSRTSRSIS